MDAGGAVVTPGETLRTMRRPLCEGLRQFMRQQHTVEAEVMDELALRGVVQLDRYDSWVLSPHGRRVWELLRLRP